MNQGDTCYSVRSAGPGAPILPAELYEEICSYAKNDTKTLLSIVRACKSFNHMCTYWIYSGVHILRSDDILTLEQAEKEPKHPLRSHPLLKWSDDMPNIDKRRRWWGGGEVVIRTDLLPATVSIEPICECCHTASSDPADEFSLLSNQISQQLPLVTTLDMAFWIMKPATRPTFPNQIHCSLAENIRARKYLFSTIDISTYESVRTKLIHVVSNPTTLNLKGLGEKNQRGVERLWNKLSSGTITVGILPEDRSSFYSPPHLTKDEIYVAATSISDLMFRSAQTSSQAEQQKISFLGTAADLDGVDGEGRKAQMSRLIQEDVGGATDLSGLRFETWKDRKDLAQVFGIRDDQC